MQQGLIGPRKRRSGHPCGRSWCLQRYKFFIWRLAKHSLPSAYVLHRRNMADHGQCALCEAPDSWKHSFLECNMARCVWALEREEIIEHLSEMQKENTRGWFANMFEIMSHADLIWVLVTMWAIWYARRKVKASKTKAWTSRWS